MKTFFKVLLTVLVATNLSVLIDRFPTLNQRSNSVKDAAIAQTTRVPASLPVRADVELKDGSTIQGQVMGIAATQQLVKVDGSDSYSLAIREIDRVDFDAEALAYRGNGSPILRDAQSGPMGETVTWSPVAISGLEIENNVRGIARIVLGSTITNVNRSGQWTYVVEELRFSPDEGTMAVKATPY